MSIFNDKRDIINQIGVLNSLKNEINPINQFDSFGSLLNEEKNVVNFLLDILVSIEGTDSINNIFSGLFTNYINEYESKIKDIFIGEYIDYDSINEIPNGLLVNGFDFDLGNIDDFDIFRTEVGSEYSSLFYDQNPNTFNYKMYEAVNTPQTDVIYNNLTFNFNSLTNNINVKINETNIRNFIYNYVNGFNRLNKKKIVSQIFNSLFGNLYKYNNNSKNEIKANEEINFLINKFVFDEAIILSETDNEKIRAIVDQLFNTTNEIDLGCGVMENKLTMEKLFEFSNDIDGNNISEFEDKLENLINNSIISESVDNGLKNNVKNNFIKRLINIFKTILMRELIMSPEKKMFILIINKMKNIDFIDNKKYFDDNYNKLKCLTANVDSGINEYLFNYISNLVINLTKPIAFKIIKEKYRNYINIIKSLVKI